MKPWFASEWHILDVIAKFVANMENILEVYKVPMTRSALVDCKDKADK